MTTSDPMAITYSDEKLRILVEEYITQQRTKFSFKGVCSYILFWAMEDGAVAQTGQDIYDNAELNNSDQARVSGSLLIIMADGRITRDSNDNTIFVKR